MSDSAFVARARLAVPFFLARAYFSALRVSARDSAASLAHSESQEGSGNWVPVIPRVNEQLMGGPGRKPESPTTNEIVWGSFDLRLARVLASRGAQDDGVNDSGASRKS